jgi:hypothetical protein
MPKVNFLMQTVQADILSPYLEEFDTAILNKVRSILKLVSFNEVNKRLVFLPIRHGGLGFQPSHTLCVAARYCSLLASREVVKKICPSLPESSELHNLREFISQLWHLDAIPLKQQKITDAYYSIQHAKLIRFLSLHGERNALARILSGSAPHAGAFLLCPPDPKLGLRLSSRAFTTAVKLRIGVPCVVMPVGNPPLCIECGHPSDHYGYHALGCNTRNSLSLRHDQLARCIQGLAKAAGYVGELELRTGATSLDRAADVGIRGEHTALAVDVTVRNPFAARYAARPIDTTRGVVAALAQAEKHTRYDAQIVSDNVIRRQQGLPEWEFIPFSVEPHGLMASEALSLLGRLADGIVTQDRETNRARAMNYAAARVSVALQSGNARLIDARCVPISVPVHGDGSQ